MLRTTEVMASCSARRRSAASPQQELRGHRGRTGDPLYRTLHTGAELLTDKQQHWLQNLFTAPTTSSWRRPETSTSGWSPLTATLIAAGP